MAKYTDAEWLREMYWEEGLTQKEIADRCDVTPRTIRHYMQEAGIETREMSGEDHPLYGESRSEEVKDQISETLTGREMSEQTRERMAASHRGMSIPEDVRERISQSLSGLVRPPETREKMSESTAGEQNPNWRGGYSRRYGPGWAPARAAVRERDRVCQHCQHDGTEHRLEVHHVVPVRRFREDPERELGEAHDLDNLVLLCRRCHQRAEHGLIEISSPAD